MIAHTPPHGVAQVDEQAPGPDGSQSPGPGATDTDLIAESLTSPDVFAELFDRIVDRVGRLP